MICFLTKLECIIKPSGFEAECLELCEDAKKFCREYSLTHTEKEGIIWYLEDLLGDIKSEKKKVHIKETLKVIREENIDEL